MSQPRNIVNGSGKSESFHLHFSFFFSEHRVIVSHPSRILLRSASTAGRRMRLNDVKADQMRRSFASHLRLPIGSFQVSILPALMLSISTHAVRCERWCNATSQTVSVSSTGAKPHDGELGIRLNAHAIANSPRCGGVKLNMRQCQWNVAQRGSRF